MNFRFNKMIIIRNNKETFAASKCSLTLINYHNQQRLLVLKISLCSICLLFRVVSCVNPNFYWCRYCVLYFYLSSCSLILHVLTEHCTHHLFVCASTAANYKPNEMIATYYTRHLCNTSFRQCCKIRSRLKACLQIQRNIGK